MKELDHGIPRRRSRFAASAATSCRAIAEPAQDIEVVGINDLGPV